MNGDHGGASEGYALRSEQTSFVPGETTAWTFEVDGPDGPPASFQIQHEKELHLIVVRDDLSTFTHVHPTRREDGAWTVSLSLPKAGPYAAFADVSPDDAGPMTLRMGLEATGEAPPPVSHEPSRRFETDDYVVELVGDVTAGAGSDIEFHVTKDSEPVTPDPYLGAAGHLVAIRSGDLDYLHVHPMDSDEIGTIPFMMHASRPGLYRLFLQFSHGGSVHTSEFTLDVSG